MSAVVSTDVSRDFSRILNYVYSSDLDDFFEIHLCSLTNIMNLLVKDIENTWLYFTIYLESEKKSSLICKSSLKPYDNASWNEWIIMNLRYKDLEKNTLIHITLWGVNSCADQHFVVGTTYQNIFNNFGEMFTGIIELKLNKSKGLLNHIVSESNFEDEDSDKVITEINYVMRMYGDDIIPHYGWLDKLTFNKFEEIQKSLFVRSQVLFVTIEFPKIHLVNNPVSVLYHDKYNFVLPEVGQITSFRIISDNDINMENIIETKHNILTRSCSLKHSVKPSALIRDRLLAISKYTINAQLTPEEKDIIWKFRFSITDNRQMLMKFLRAVNWTREDESEQALYLMTQWNPLKPEEALELLIPSIYSHKVAEYAVSRISMSTIQNVATFMQQLVQCLFHYENVDKYRYSTEVADKDLLDIKPENAQHFHGIVNCKNKFKVSDVVDLLLNDPENNAFNEDKTHPPFFNHDDDNMYLKKFLIERCSEVDTLATSFYWHLVVEISSSNEPIRKIVYSNVLRQFSLYLMHKSNETRKRRRLLGKQFKLINILCRLCDGIEKVGTSRKKRVSALHQILLSSEYTFKDPLHLPLQPDIHICGFIPSKSSIFNSKLMPIKLTFLTNRHNEYTVILKNGDDIRQDELVLRVISFINDILLRENLDLKLTPYKVVATGPEQGLVEFIDSESIGELLSKEGSIQNFLRKVAPSNRDIYGINANVMDNYVKSCAGYSVITYILGIGDRHLDNLLLTKMGILFHIDFGYILGRDPKPFPPPMKLSREMIEAMGGETSEHYKQFKNLCFTIFILLRRNANSILNMFALMLDSNIVDIALEPDKALQKIEEKFRLDLDDEQAVIYLMGLIDESVKAVFVNVVEQIHKWAQYWRK